MRKFGQVLTDIKHGGHAVEETAPAAVALSAERESLTLLADAAGEVTFETPFDYLFADLANDPASHLPADDPAAVVAALKALGDAMVEEPLAAGEDPLQPAGNSTIPPVYTYWGQFLDHDLTANTDRNSEISDITKPDLAPLDPSFVVENLKNLRQPTVNLDSVYGDGPTFAGQPPTQAGSFYSGIKFKIGTASTNAGIGGVRIPPVDDLKRDLPRVNKIAQIADARNDENLIIAQLHTAFLRFHNAAVDWVRDYEPEHATNPVQHFERAQQLTRWQHQWLVINDFLDTMALPGIADEVLYRGAEHYYPMGDPFMPLEFSVAAYRFGHTMVRAAYDHNRNFGRPGPEGNTPLLPNSPFNLLFAFTGNGFPNPFLGQADVLPFNWIIEWDRFVDKGSSVPDHFARKIDTQLAPPLKDLVNEGNLVEEADPDKKVDIVAILKGLARRNLLRGYLLSIPTGQSVAEAMGIAPLTPEELTQGGSDTLKQVLTDNGFLERTPLWYYVLKEAEVRANGNSLGELGSRIVCETIIGQLRYDQTSYLNVPGGWDPGKGVRLPDGKPVVTIGGFIRFGGIPA
ncbi:MAG: hypothetical protein H7145_16760 [Akkermansiaceae bacterium]|nr:hypothetical protein [Armatimonadota bacterium]